MSAGNSSREGAAASEPIVPAADPAGLALTVKLPAFEGPLDLLLHLIRKQQIDIKDIPIVLITEQYIDSLNLMKELNLDLAGEYLVMAATLIHIKSKMLLPVDPAGEDGNLEDPRAELVRQLLEYEKFKRAADVLYERERIERATRPRGAPSEFVVEEEHLIEASLFDLVAAFRELLQESARSDTFTIEAYRVSVTDRVAELITRLEREPELNFRDLFEPNASREEWIVTFLALLELARLRVVRILQRNQYGEILLRRREDAPTLAAAQALGLTADTPVASPGAVAQSESVSLPVGPLPEEVSEEPEPNDVPGDSA